MHKTQIDIVCWMLNANLLLKTLVSEMVRSSAGREFHDSGPEKEKAHSPNLVHSWGVV